MASAGGEEQYDFIWKGNYMQVYMSSAKAKSKIIVCLFIPLTWLTYN